MQDEADYAFVRELGRLDELLRVSARRTPEAVLLRFPDRTCSYGEADQAADRFAAALLAGGHRAGDRVAILADNGLEFVATFYGSIRAGGVAVPVNTAVDGPGLRYVLSNSGARVLVAVERFLPVVRAALDPIDTAGPTEGVSGDGMGNDPTLAVEEIYVTGEKVEATRRPVLALSEILGQGGADPVEVEVGSPELPAAIIYTSGSTGDPRGATLSHRNILANTWSILEYLRLTADDRMMVVLPFYYVYGASLLHTHVAVGASLSIGTELYFPNRVVDRMHRDTVTGFAGVPSSFTVLLHRSRLAEDVPPSLRYLTQAGGAMAPELTREILARLPGVRLFVMYGATEASARLSYLDPDDLPRKLGSIGRAIPGVTLRVLREDGSEADVDEPGELVAQGENIMCGYWNAPEETAAVLGPEGLRTGDLARRDADGFLYIVGRKKEMIKTGAHRVSPKEIEEKIAEHPDVLESAVIGVPDELLGEAIVAFVVPRGTPAEFDPRALQRFLMERLPEYKVPRTIEVHPSLPKNESGKIQKRELRAAWMGESGSAESESR